MKRHHVGTILWHHSFPGFEVRERDIEREKGMVSLFDWRLSIDNAHSWTSTSLLQLIDFFRYTIILHRLNFLPHPVKSSSSFTKNPSFSFFVFSTMIRSLPLFLLVLGLFSSSIESLRFELQSGHTKCISEDIKSNSMTVGKYTIVNPNEGGQPVPDSHKVTVRVYIFLKIPNFFIPSCFDSRFLWFSLAGFDFGFEFRIPFCR